VPALIGSQPVQHMVAERSSFNLVNRENWLMFGCTKWQSVCTMLCIMATSSSAPEVAASSSTANPPVPGSAKRSIVSLLIYVVAGALISSAVLGGGLYYLARSGRLSLGKSSASKPMPAVEVHTHLLGIDPLLVNLADPTGTSYVRVSISLELEDAPKDKEKPKDAKGEGAKSGADDVAAIRDTALSVLGQQTANSLLAPHGKEDLKADLLKAFNEHNPSLKIKTVLFTDFLVQR
jgi:flagellar FliL protein